ncbi:MAG: hypothetical protein NTV80_09200 [Verrucomicrobia bacterium]|nr:hypothetical protein [Verrucomicrobiota bacterium]
MTSFLAPKARTISAWANGPGRSTPAHRSGEGLKARPMVPAPCLSL